MSESKTEICRHPLAGFFLTRLRDRDRSPQEFRQDLSALSKILLIEASRDFLQLPKMTVKTPLETCHEGRGPDPQLCGVSIMRAGNGMLEAFAELFPWAPIGHIGLVRREEPAGLATNQYYLRFPETLKSSTVILMDPMLATGGTAKAAFDKLQEFGCQRVRLVCVIASPEGVRHLSETCPDLEIFIGSMDRELDEKSYILPGLGDAGDRIYGTL